MRVLIEGSRQVWIGGALSDLDSIGLSKTSSFWGIYCRYAERC